MHVGGFRGRNVPIPGGVWEMVCQGNPWGGAGGYRRRRGRPVKLPEAIRAGIVAMVRAAVQRESH